MRSHGTRRRLSLSGTVDSARGIWVRQTYTPTPATGLAPRWSSIGDRRGVKGLHHWGARYCSMRGSQLRSVPGPSVPAARASCSKRLMGSGSRASSGGRTLRATSGRGAYRGHDTPPPCRPYRFSRRSGNGRRFIRGRRVDATILTLARIRGGCGGSAITFTGRPQDLGTWGPSSGISAAVFRAKIEG